MARLLQVVFYLFLVNLFIGFYSSSGIYRVKLTQDTSIVSPPATNLSILNTIIHPYNTVSDISGIIGWIFKVLDRFTNGLPNLLSTIIGSDDKTVLFITYIVTSPINLLITIFVFQVVINKMFNTNLNFLQ